MYNDEIENAHALVNIFNRINVLIKKIACEIKRIKTKIKIPHFSNRFQGVFRNFFGFYGG